MVTSNQTHIDPADYFAPDYPQPKQPFIVKYFFNMAFPVFTIPGYIMMRKIQNRPLLSGIHMFPLIFAASVVAGFAFTNWREEHLRRKRAVIYDYILKNREEFPPVERVKYKDVLEKWNPVRI